jgi:FlaG/FlaF family flagellin (archaellin)
MLLVTASAQDNNVKLTITHAVGDDLAVADLEIRASTSTGMTTFDFPGDGTFSEGDNTTASYAYGADPGNETITVRIIHKPTEHEIFSREDVFVSG